MVPNPLAPLAESMLGVLFEAPRSLEEVRTLVSIARSLDREQLDRIKDKYQQEIRDGHPAGPQKYIDVAVWLGEKMSAARSLGLSQSKKLSILDLGTGAGHFLAIAKQYGHEVMGIDIENPIYTDLADLFGVTRLIQSVDPQTPLPSYGRKFDLVTAFMISFNSLPPHRVPRVYWTHEDWAFLLNDLVVNHMTFPGRIYFGLNQNQADDKSYYNDEKLVDWFESIGANVDRTALMIDLPLEGPRVFRA